MPSVRWIILPKTSVQEELLQALGKRALNDASHLVARLVLTESSQSGQYERNVYGYVLPNNIMYKRSNDQSASEMLMTSDSFHFISPRILPSSHARPGYASSIFGLHRQTANVPPYSGTHYRRDDDNDGSTARPHPRKCMFFITNHS